MNVYKDAEINILGTNYKIEYVDPETLELKDCYGYVDFTSKTITIGNVIPGLDNDAIKIAAVVRHEIIHAFMYESGLQDSWEHTSGQDETMVDWFALQFPKISKVFKEIGVDKL